MTEEEKNEQYLRDKETREKIKTAFLFSLTGMMLGVMEVLVLYALDASRSKMEAELLAASQWVVHSIEGYYFTKIFAVLQTEILALFLLLLLVRLIRKLRKNKPVKQLLPVWVWLIVFALVGGAAASVISGAAADLRAVSPAFSPGGEAAAETLTAFFESAIRAIYFAEAALAALIGVFSSWRKSINLHNRNKKVEL